MCVGTLHMQPIIGSIVSVAQHNSRWLHVGPVHPDWQEHVPGEVHVPPLAQAGLHTAERYNRWYLELLWRLMQLHNSNYIIYLLQLSPLSNCICVLQGHAQLAVSVLIQYIHKFSAHTHVLTNSVHILMYWHIMSKCGQRPRLHRVASPSGQRRPSITIWVIAAGWLYLGIVLILFALTLVTVIHLHAHLASYTYIHHIKRIAWSCLSFTNKAVPKPSKLSAQWLTSPQRNSFQQPRMLTAKVPK